MDNDDSDDLYINYIDQIGKLKVARTIECR